jgi:hypothetical protein
MTRVTLALLFLASPLLGLAWCALSALEDRRPARAIAWAGALGLYVALLALGAWRLTTLAIGALG